MARILARGDVDRRPGDVVVGAPQLEARTSSIPSGSRQAVLVRRPYASAAGNMAIVDATVVVIYSAQPKDIAVDDD